jgi:hypothetical protein
VEDRAVSAQDDTTALIVRGTQPDEHDTTELHLLVNRVPRYEEMRWDQHGPIYLAEQDGFVSQLHYERPGEGFYGGVFHLTVEDGSSRALIGPSSGGTHTVNAARCELAAVDVPLSEGASVHVPFLAMYPGAINGEKLADIHRQFSELAEQQRQAIAARVERQRREQAVRECWPEAQR